jgi:cellulose synthase/poly-beta-1,6-N-acetylglucosamine synthase-like glycosyltransferase
MACKGEEPHLEENIDAILKQSYPKFRLIIVTDSPDDPAYSVANQVLNRHPGKDARLFTANAHPSASGKVAALLSALESDAWASEVYAFVDSDALTSGNWLRDIIDPLVDPSIGATTGFRWYFPEKGGFWPQVESAWNASGTNVMFNERYNFPWGGAMAMMRDTMNKINLRSVWETAVSDDLSLNNALRQHNYRIEFLPQCTVVTYSRATARSFLMWATRQIAITRAFNRKLWDYGLMAYGFFTALSAFGLASLIAGLTLSAAWLLPAALLLIPSVLGVLRSNERMKTFKHAMPEYAGNFKRSHWAHATASLIVPWIMTYCILKSARMNEIDWRGRKYKLTGSTRLAPT